MTIPRSQSAETIFFYENGIRKVSLTLCASALILVSLPLTQLFTIHVGFPLKVYELAIALWTILCIVRLHIPLFSRKIIFRGFIFFAYVILALIIIICFCKKAPFADSARFTPIIDGLLKSGYIFLCILGFNIVACATSRASDFMVRCWLWGATFSAIIHFYLAAITAMGHPIPELPGMHHPVNQQLAVFHGIEIFRAGTFLEGNYAGPFFVLSFLIAMTFRRFWHAVLFLAAVIASFSTVAITGLAICIVYIAWKNRRNAGALILMFILSICLLTASAPLLKTFFIDKLTDTDESSSLTDRQKSFNVAWEIFTDHPLLGVGTSQYGTHFEAHHFWVKVQNAPSVMSDDANKQIPNNIYVELLSEYGIIGIGLFVFFLLSILHIALKNSPVPLKAGVFSIFLFWLASPTFTLMYYWIYFAVVCGLVYSPQMKSLTQNTLNKHCIRKKIT